MFLTIYGVEKSQCDHSNILPFVEYWHRLENQEISLVKTIEHLPKAADYFLVKYLCCKTEHKTQGEFPQKTKDFEVLGSKI